ncbi:MAG: UDP-N-acetylglucosamine 1-carboxyvinyltransferase [Bacteroidota bacterium]
MAGTSESFRVAGGATLSGSITPQGAKNGALQLISAVLLTEEEVHISNVPDILDVRRLIDLLRGLGVEITRMSTNAYTFRAVDIDLDYLASPSYQSTAKRIRGSVMLMGPMIARFRRAYMPKPGGDKIGRRRIDTHINGFKKLGADFDFDKERDSYYLGGEDLKGNYILMDEISVTGTANLVMAAVLTPGETTLYNAACEPYLQQLCQMLQAMGAKITGIGSNRLIITGVDSLGGTSIRVMPDFIEIGSFIGLAAMTQSKLTIKGAGQADLGIIPNVFSTLGIDIQWQDDDLIIPEMDIYEVRPFIDGSILTIYDAPWPGFTPDLISILLVVATQAKGSVLIHQKMFESRLFFTDKLIDMGAKVILCDPHRATVIGLARQQRLRGIEMTSPDIRAGVSLLIAALSAEGSSLIHNIQQIDRGYESIDSRLNAIGAEIERITL